MGKKGVPGRENSLCKGIDRMRSCGKLKMARATNFFSILNIY